MILSFTQLQTNSGFDKKKNLSRNCQMQSQSMVEKFLHSEQCSQLRENS